MNGTFERVLRAYSMDLYGKYEKASEIYKEMTDNINLISDGIFAKGALLFGLAEHVRIAGLKDGFVDGTSINDMVGILLREWARPCPTVTGKYKNEINTSNLGIIYGGLASINRYLKREDIILATREIREYVFGHNISGGMLVSNSTKELSSDIILAAVPFGMFSPEDLVLVEAVSEIEKKPIEDDISFLLLSWYYAEKGDYAKARLFLKKYNVNDRDDAVGKSIKNLVLKTLEDAGESQGKVIHRPYGNGNRYVCCNCERTPNDPKEGDTVIIKAMAWPDYPDNFVLLHYSINGGSETTVSGRNMNSSEGYWEWEIGPFKRFDRVDYHFSAEDGTMCTEDYGFTVWGGKNAVSIRDIARVGEGCIKVTAEDSKGEICPDIYILPQNGCFKISFNKQTDYVGEAFSLADMDGIYTINFNNTMIEIYKNPFSIKIIYQGKSILQTTETNWLRWYEDGYGHIKEIICSFKASYKERYYGFGERYNSINQRGNSPDVYVYNEYKDQGIRTYIPVPYFISSSGYGMYIDTPCYVKFDMANSHPDESSFSVEDSGVCFYIITGKPKDVIMRFTEITGKPALMPKWAFGPWMSSNNWDNEAEVRRQVEITKEYGVPATVLVIEAWSDEATYYIFNDAVYDENDGSSGFEYKDFKFSRKGRWPGPKELIEYLHNNGLKCILWQIPIIKSIKGIRNLQNDSDEKYAISQGYCVKNPDGTPYRIPEGWFKNSLILDFTNREATRWWFEKRRYLLEEIGVDGFKTDGGEFVFGSDLRFYDGHTGKEMRNLYPNEYVGAYYRFVNHFNPSGGITFSRAGFTGAQRYPAHWAGDEKSTFKAFKNSIIAGLTAGMSGIPFWGWDLAGFSGEIPSSELYIRAAQMATFCPIMQYHAESRAEFNQDRTPWNIAERTGDIRALNCYRYYACLRMNILPYIYNEAMKSSKTGLPLMRAMFIEYPEDENCRDISDQYMFGDSFLVAPILEEGWTGRNVYLPHGKWIDFWDGSLIEGGKEIYVGASIEKIPVFVKYGSVIPMNLNDHFKVGGSITDPSRHYENFCLCVYGDHINNYEFEDDHCNRLLLSTEVEKIIIEMNWEPQPAIRTNVGNAEIFINGVKTKTERLTAGDNYYLYKPKQ